MKNSLYQMINDVQNGDNEKIMDIITKFKPLIKKFSRKLIYEEAKTDLIITFIEMIKTMNLSNFSSKDEGKIVNYIIRVIKNKHIDLFRKNIQNKPEELEINLDIIQDTINCNIESNIFIQELFSILTKKQRLILTEKYVNDHSDIEIAKKLNISRQAINKSQKRALKKLKIYLESNFMEA